MSVPSRTGAWVLAAHPFTVRGIAVEPVLRSGTCCSCRMRGGTDARGARARVTPPTIRRRRCTAFGDCRPPGPGPGAIRAEGGRGRSGPSPGRWLPQGARPGPLSSSARRCVQRLAAHAVRTVAAAGPATAACSAAQRRPEVREAQSPVCCTDEVLVLGLRALVGQGSSPGRLPDLNSEQGDVVVVLIAHELVDDAIAQRLRPVVGQGRDEPAEPLSALVEVRAPPVDPAFDQPVGVERQRRPDRQADRGLGACGEPGQRCADQVGGGAGEPRHRAVGSPQQRREVPRVAVPQQSPVLVGNEPA